MVSHVSRDISSAARTIGGDSRRLTKEQLTVQMLYDQDLATSLSFRSASNKKSGKKSDGGYEIGDTSRQGARGKNKDSRQRERRNRD
jgi:hypothetical protein